MSAVSAPYRPGQSPWPDNQSQRPDRPPPLQFQNGNEAPRGNQALAWTLRIAGLVAVAVLSGFVWSYIQHEGSSGDPTGSTGETQQQSAGKYEFTSKLDSPQVDSNCGEHAYDATQQFLTEHPCEQLTRSVFTTTVNGRTVYSSVSVVDFVDGQTAVDLQKLTESNGTGNVNDLVREGVIKVDGLKTLSARGGYESQVQGGRITIVESDYDPQSADGGTEEELDDVSKDALRLGDDITASGG